MKPNYVVKYTYCDRMCAVFDCLVVFQFLFCNFRSTLDNLEPAYFISS